MRHARHIVIGLLLLAAVIGVWPFLHLVGCANIPTSGTAAWYNNVTTQQVTEALKVGGDVGTVVVTAVGHPEWAIIIDLVVRLAAVVAAWLIRPPAGVKPPDSTV